MSIFQFLQKGCPKSHFFQLFIKIIISPKILLFKIYYNYRIINNESNIFYILTKKTKKIIKYLSKMQFISLFSNISKFKNKNGDFRGMKIKYINQ